MAASKLVKAIQSRQFDEVKTLLQGAKPSILDGSDGDKYSGDGEGMLDGRPFKTPLGEAARYGYVEVVDQLLTAGAPVDSPDYRNETPFIQAIMAGQLEVAKRLVAAGADVHHVSWYGNVLHHVVRVGEIPLECIRYCLELGVDPTVKLLGKDAYDRLGFEPAALKAKARDERRQAAIALEIVKLLRAHWRGATKKLDAALAKAGVAADEKKALDKKAASGFDALAPGPKRKAAILKAIGKSVDGRREELEALAKGVLARPDVVADPEWGDFVRALTRLTASWPELMKAQFGVDVSIEDEGDDESGTMEMIGDEGLSTIEIALGLLALPEAIARADWAALVGFVCEEKQARLGGWSFGDEEIAALFKVPAAKRHPEAAALKKVARRAFPYAGIPR